MKGGAQASTQARRTARVCGRDLMIEQPDLLGRLERVEKSSSTRFRNSRSASRLVVRVVNLPGPVKDVSAYLDKHTESDLAALIEAVPRFTGPVPTRLSEVSAEPVCRLWPAKVSRAARATPPDTRWTQPRVGARGNQAPSHERHAAAQAAWRPRGPRAESCGVGPQVIGVVVGSGAASQGAESRSPRVVRA